MFLLVLAHHERTLRDLDETEQRLVRQIPGIGPEPRVPYEPEGQAGRAPTPRLTLLLDGLEQPWQEPAS